MRAPRPVQSPSGGWGVQASQAESSWSWGGLAAGGREGHPKKLEVGVGGWRLEGLDVLNKFSASAPAPQNSGGAQGCRAGSRGTQPGPQAPSPGGAFRPSPLGGLRRPPFLPGERSRGARDGGSHWLRDASLGPAPPSRAPGGTNPARAEAAAARPLGFSRILFWGCGRPVGGAAASGLRAAGSAAA